MNGHANGIDYEHHSSKYHQKLGSNDYQVFPYSTMQQYPFSTNYQIDNYGFYSNDAYHQDDTRMVNTYTLHSLSLITF